MRRLVTTALAGLLAAAPAAAQEDPDDGRPRVRATATAGLSLRDGPDGFRFGRDARAVAVRLQLARRGGLEPWLEVGAYDRADFDCATVGDAPCNADGLTARAGAAALFGPPESERRPGLRGELLAGLGAAFADETKFSYLFGLEVQWAAWPGILPVAGVRYERFPGLTNVGMAHAGIRIQL